jgi:hypothetical protein
MLLSTVLDSRPKVLGLECIVNVLEVASNPFDLLLHSPNAMRGGLYTSAGQTFAPYRAETELMEERVQHEFQMGIDRCAGYGSGS